MNIRPLLESFESVMFGHIVDGGNQMPNWLLVLIIVFVAVALFGDLQYRGRYR